MKGAQDARERLHQSYVMNEIGKEENINLLIKNEKDALHAMNLSRLLTKNWAEFPNSYRICTQLKNRDEKRL